MAVSRWKLFFNQKWASEHIWAELDTFQEERFRRGPKREPFGHQGGFVQHLQCPYASEGPRTRKTKKK